MLPAPWGDENLEPIPCLHISILITLCLPSFSPQQILQLAEQLDDAFLLGDCVRSDKSQIEILATYISTFTVIDI